jgi:hypothetical protein
LLGDFGQLDIELPDLVGKGLGSRFVVLPLAFGFLASELLAFLFGQLEPVIRFDDLLFKAR